MRESEERYTQWVRATYPYVDSYRAPILSQFESRARRVEGGRILPQMVRSLHTHECLEIPQRVPLRGISDKRGRLDRIRHSAADVRYEGAFAKSGERRDQKGHETWTADDSTMANTQAEKLFTLIGITQRDMTPLFSPRVFPLATDDGMTTFAQAIFYNANEQKPDPIGTKSKTQAKVAWDTLNWDPATPAPEWGALPTHVSANKWPWELFGKDNSHAPDHQRSLELASEAHARHRKPLRRSGHKRPSQINRCSRTSIKANRFSNNWSRH